MVSPLKPYKSEKEEQILATFTYYFYEFHGSQPFDQTTFLEMLVDQSPYDEFVQPLIKSIFHKRFGYYPLAIASVVENENNKFIEAFRALESFPGSKEEKLFLIRLLLAKHYLLACKNI